MDYTIAHLLARLRLLHGQKCLGKGKGYFAYIVSYHGLKFGLCHTRRPGP
jgi:hypothetical protein